MLDEHTLERIMTTVLLDLGKPFASGKHPSGHCLHITKEDRRFDPQADREIARPAWSTCT